MAYGGAAAHHRRNGVVVVVVVIPIVGWMDMKISISRNRSVMAVSARRTLRCRRL